MIIRDEYKSLARDLHVKAASQKAKIERTAVELQRAYERGRKDCAQRVLDRAKSLKEKVGALGAK